MLCRVARGVDKAFELATLPRGVRAYAEAGIDVCIVNPIADLSAVPQVLEDMSGCLDGLDLRNSGVIRATGS